MMHLMLEEMHGLEQDFIYEWLRLSLISKSGKNRLKSGLESKSTILTNIH